MAVDRLTFPHIRTGLTWHSTSLPTCGTALSWPTQSKELGVWVGAESNLTEKHPTIAKPSGYAEIKRHKHRMPE